MSEETEKLKEEEINVEEEATTEEEAAEENGSEWVEEITAAGEDIINVVKSLIHEAGVRRIVVKNEEKRINLEIPLWLGLAGIALLPVYAALAVIAALLVDCKILVEREAKEPADMEDVEISAA